VGLKPDEVPLIIQTHLHYDHCGNTAKCQRARVVVQEDELKFAHSPHPIMANLYHRPFLDSVDFMTIRGRCEIVPGIEVFPVPGHSPGAQAVVVATDQGKAVISGFCCMRENFEPPLEVRGAFPVLAPGIHTNAVDAFDNVQRLKGFADILIPQHDQYFLDVERLP
jgi:N-acyl homoserine lactone hydrolase